MKTPFLVYDQSRAATKRQIRPGPLQYDEQPVLETCQEVNVDNQPHHPRDETGKLEPTDFDHRTTSTDGGHLALIDKMKRFV